MLARHGEAAGTPPTRFLCGPQLCCFFGPRNETLPANNPTRVLIFADDPALTGGLRGLCFTPEAVRPRLPRFSGLPLRNSTDTVDITADHFSFVLSASW